MSGLVTTFNYHYCYLLFILIYSLIYLFNCVCVCGCVCVWCHVNVAFTVLCTSYSSLYNIVFSHEVTAAMLVSQNKEIAAMLVSQTKPLGIELYFYANTFFCFSKPIWQLVTWMRTLYKWLIKWMKKSSKTDTWLLLFTRSWYTIHLHLKIVYSKFNKIYQCIILIVRF